MGKRWSNKKKKSQTKQKSNKPRKPWVPVLPGNAKMEAYYALQGLHNQSLEGGTFVENTTDAEKETERIKWITSLQSMLPASFRIGTDVDPVVRERIEYELDSHFCDKEMEIVVDDSGESSLNQEGNVEPKSSTTVKKVTPARHIPFIPHAYQLSVDRRTIRRNAALQDFHEWLTSQTSCGNITRQETVSMIPPIVLNVEPHHRVLDMCAAPGSKTSQLLEIVSTATEKGDVEPRGCVVANDSDSKRAYMLVHQLKRINSPAVLVTSCDAQFFPLLKDDAGTKEGIFDRVLCDVPCSGDGTTRKNPGVWRHWSCTGSLSLHPLQLGIALNGARLTKVGGYLCYSTCAMNPIENEAVVAELLRASDGALELADCRSHMPGLVARPGWSSWRVFRENQTRKEVKNHRKKNNAKMQKKRAEWNKKNGGGSNDGDSSEAKKETNDTNEDEANMVSTTNGNDSDAEAVTQDASTARSDETTRKDDKSKVHGGGPPPSWDDETLLQRATAEGLFEFKSFDDVPEEWRHNVRKTCFPPTPEEAAKFELEKCLRCLPHDMDTGGFFVALLKKVSPLSAKAKKEALELAQEFRPEAVGTEGNGETCTREPEPKRIKTDDAAVESSGSDIVDCDMQIDTSEVDAGQELNETAEEDKKSANKKAKRGKSGANKGDDGFVPVNAETWKELEDYYGFSEDFPKEQYMCRAGSEQKVLHFLGAPIVDLFKRGIQERVTIIHSGLKGFARNNKDCEVRYRVAQEGIQFLAPYMTKRKIVADIGDFAKCVDTESNLRLGLFSDDFAEQVRKLDPGSFVVALKGYENDVFRKLFIVMWRCRKEAIDCLVGKVELEGMKSKIRAIPGYVEPQKDGKKDVDKDANDSSLKATK